MLVKPLVRPIVRAIAGRPTASLGGGFAPTSLFAANEPGYLYDLDDLSTVFLDSAGTTPASVNGLVGLQLDKSLGLVLGAELVVNGGFDTDTSWIKTGDATVSGGTGNLNGAVATALLAQNIGLSVGKLYEVVFDVTAIAGTMNVVDNSGLGGILGTFTTTGRKTFRFTHNNVSGNFIFRCGLGSNSASVDNVSVKEVRGNHRYQSTTGSKPILRGTPTGSNLASGASWTAGTGWSVAGDTATATTSSGTLTAAAVAAVVGKFYRVTYTITRTAGSIQPTFGGRTGTSRSASGTYVQYFDNAASTAALVFTGTGFTGTVTLNSIELVDVSAGSVTAPYALQYDGVDDFLQTASVDFSATDKVTVCHGMRKLSDAAQGMVVELSVDASSGTNTGAFHLRTPNSAGTTTVAYTACGTTVKTAQNASFAAPITGVITGITSVSAPQSILRTNGVVSQEILTTLGTGNFGNYPFYFGRRAGSSMPYNGLEFSSICIGRLLTAAELANTERWVGRKTGVTI